MHIQSVLTLPIYRRLFFLTHRHIHLSMHARMYAYLYTEMSVSRAREYGSRGSSVPVSSCCWREREEKV